MGSAHETIRNCVSVGSLWHGIIAGTDPNSSTQHGFGDSLENNLVLGHASGLPVMVTDDGGMTTTADASVATVSSTRASGDPAALLGWAPRSDTVAPSTFSRYQGGGPGTDNRPGQRT
jgi:hypothetical protein